jgi:plastocyanin
MAVKLRPGLALGTLALALAIGGCGSKDKSTGSGASSGGGGASAVQIKGYSFKPATITVKKGTRVTWTNADSTNHTATASNGGFDTGTLAKGQKKVVTLSKPGRFAYVCSFHPFMKGTVVVR